MAILQFLAGTRLIWDLAPTGPNAQRYSGLSLLGQEIPFPPFPIQDPLADLLCLGPGPGIPQSVSPQEQMPPNTSKPEDLSWPHEKLHEQKRGEFYQVS